jgi:hypothetical protein
MNEGYGASKSKYVVKQKVGNDELPALRGKKKRDNNDSVIP